MLRRPSNDATDRRWSGIRVIPAVNRILHLQQNVKFQQVVIDLAVCFPPWYISTSVILRVVEEYSIMALSPRSPFFKLYRIFFFAVNFIQKRPAGKGNCYSYSVCEEALPRYAVSLVKDLKWQFSVYSTWSEAGREWYPPEHCLHPQFSHVEYTGLTATRNLTQVHLQKRSLCKKNFLCGCQVLLFFLLVLTNDLMA